LSLTSVIRDHHVALEAWQKIFSTYMQMLGSTNLLIQLITTLAQYSSPTAVGRQQQ
jgi:hypothetical protein